MNKRAEYLLHTIGEIRHKIELLNDYLEWLGKELEKELKNK